MKVTGPNPAMSGFILICYECLECIQISNRTYIQCEKQIIMSLLGNRVTIFQQKEKSTQDMGNLYIPVNIDLS